MAGFRHSFCVAQHFSCYLTFICFHFLLDFFQLFVNTSPNPLRLFFLSLYLIMWLQFTIYPFNRVELRSSGKNTVSLYYYTTGKIISLWEDEWMNIKDNFRVIYTIQTISMRSEGVICNTILTMLGKLSSDGVLGGLRGKGTSVEYSFTLYKYGSLSLGQ